MANAALLGQFPIMHSFLLTETGRGVLARLAPRGTGGALATTTYVTIASLQIFALFALWSPTGVIWWQAEGTNLALMSALYASAWLLLGKAMADAGLSLRAVYWDGGHYSATRNQYTRRCPRPGYSVYHGNPSMSHSL